MFHAKPIKQSGSMFLRTNKQAKLW